MTSLGIGLISGVRHVSADNIYTKYVYGKLLISVKD